MAILSQLSAQTVGKGAVPVRPRKKRKRTQCSLCGQVGHNKRNLKICAALRKLRGLGPAAEGDLSNAQAPAPAVAPAAVAPAAVAPAAVPMAIAAPGAPCRECGNTVPPGFRFCGCCGVPIVAHAVPAVVARAAAAVRHLQQG